MRELLSQSAGSRRFLPDGPRAALSARLDWLRFPSLRLGWAGHPSPVLQRLAAAVISSPVPPAVSEESPVTRKRSKSSRTRTATAGSYESIQTAQRPAGPAGLAALASQIRLWFA